MTNSQISIRQIVNIPLWEKIQTKLADLASVSIVMVDYKGFPVTMCSNSPNFCTAIHSNPILRKKCFRCNAMAGLESVRNNKPHCYFCQYGLMEIAVAISYDERYIGAVIIGRRKFNSKRESINKPEKLIAEQLSVTDAVSENYDLPQLYDQIEACSTERLYSVAELVKSELNYILAEAGEKINLQVKNEWLTNIYNVPTQHINPFYSIPNRENHKIGSIRAVNDEISEEENVSTSIKNVLDYIESHRDQVIRMEDMAEMCRLSPTYFCKLFVKETGEGLKEYVMRKKIEWSKEMLSNTNIPVSQIAKKLGFTDSSYFGKVFKKYESVTPVSYRNSKL